MSFVCWKQFLDNFIRRGNFTSGNIFVGKVLHCYQWGPCDRGPNCIQSSHLSYGIHSAQSDNPERISGVRVDDSMRVRTHIVRKIQALSSEITDARRYIHQVARLQMHAATPTK